MFEKTSHNLSQAIPQLIVHRKLYLTRIGLICLFGVLHRFQHCTGHITTGSWKGRGNQYIEFVRVLYCKLSTNGKQLPAFPRETVRGLNPGLRGGRRECYHSATVAPPYRVKYGTGYIYIFVYNGTSIPWVTSVKHFRLFTYISEPM